MADIHITRQHGLSLEVARRAAFEWIAQAKVKFDMTCAYEEGSSSDQCSFSRSGVSGMLWVDKDSFKLQAKLGFFLSAFKDKIESEIVKNLEALISNHAPEANQA